MALELVNEDEVIFVNVLAVVIKVTVTLIVCVITIFEKPEICNAELPLDVIEVDSGKIDVSSFIKGIVIKLIVVVNDIEEGE